MANWTCRCSAKNAERDRYCEGCGTENPKAPRPLTVVPKLPETQQPWTPPTYPTAGPGDDAAIRATIATLHTAPWWRDTQGTARVPAVDPAIRAEVARRAGPVALAEVVPAVFATTRRKA